MLHLIIGPDWTANRDRIMECLTRDIAGEKGGRILMVPELISHETERRLCRQAGDTASRYAEVLSFTRLGRRMMELVGSVGQETLDNGGRVVAMAASARQLASRLKAYGAVETKPEFLTGLVDGVDELKRCCITPEDLRQAARQAQGSFAQKLEELALLLETYDALCARGKKDPRDQMTWVLEQLELGDYGQTHTFYIDGFPDFTRQHMAILEHLIQVSPDVTVSLNCDSVDSGAMAFEKAGKTAASLVRFAQQAGISWEITTVPGRQHPLEPMVQRIFQGKTQGLGLEDRVTVVRCDSKYDECVAAAQRVLDLVAQGSRYRDISLVCTDPGAYGGPLEMVFRRCGIPLYLAGTEDILEKPVVVTVLAAMDAALGGLERREVLRYLKSMLSPLTPDLCDQVENYCILWNIQGTGWEKTWKNHPRGLGQDWTEEDRQWLAMLEDARKRAIQPLTRLRQGFQKASNLSQQVQALWVFLQDLALDRQLEALASQLNEAGDSRQAQMLNQLWEILLDAMDQMVDILGETVWEADVFTRLFRLLLSQYDVGTIPTVLDAVIAGPVSAMRCQQSAHLLVLGAVEGSLPSYGVSQGILTDAEREALRALGVPLTGGALEGVSAEFSEIYGVFCGAEETLWVSYPGGQPSFICKRLGDMVGGEGEPGLLLGQAMTDPLEAAAYFVRWKAAEQAEAVGLEGDYGEISRRRDHTLGTISPQGIRSLYGDTLRLSASQIDKMAQCRLAYFLQYGLKAEERKEATVDPTEFGTFVHDVLEHTGREVMARGGFHQVPLEDTLEIANRHAREYAAQRFAQLDSPRLQYLFQRNGYELELVVQELWEELHQSRFQPVDFETAFGFADSLSPIALGGSRIQAQLRGFVDRVDSWKELGQNYFRVVDYKTGKKDFDYCDVFNGLGLQMLLYLFALESGGTSILGEAPVPAGVQYMGARVPLIPADGRMTDEQVVDARKKLRQRKGLVLKDAQVLRAMEPEAEEGRIPYKEKDGELTGDLVDRQQLRALRYHMERTLCRMVDTLADGDVTANPYTRGSSFDACGYCPFDPVCHKAQVTGRRNYKTMTAREFWEAVEKEESHG